MNFGFKNIKNRERHFLATSSEGLVNFWTTNYEAVEAISEAYEIPVKIYWFETPQLFIKGNFFFEKYIL